MHYHARLYSTACVIHGAHRGQLNATPVPVVKLFSPAYSSIDLRSVTNGAFIERKFLEHLVRNLVTEGPVSIALQQVWTILDEEEQRQKSADKITQRTSDTSKNAFSTSSTATAAPAAVSLSNAPSLSTKATTCHIFQAASNAAACAPSVAAVVTCHNSQAALKAAASATSISTAGTCHNSQSASKAAASPYLVSTKAATCHNLQPTSKATAIACHNSRSASKAAGPTLVSIAATCHNPQATLKAAASVTSF